jgi:DNA-binding MarR family transcriptional regulator/GNAT superfamily N-acetyltransferase
MAAPPSPTALVRAFSRELALAGGLLSPDYLDSGLSLGEARCLYELGQGAGLTLSELAGRLGLDLGYVSRVVTRMGEAGLAEKRPGRDDRRARRVALTKAGRARLAALSKRVDERLGEWLASKPPGGVAELTRGLGSFLEARPGGDEARATLRAPRPGDLGQIIARHGQLYVEEFGYPAYFESYVVEAFAQLLRGFTPPGDRIFVAERGGRFAGSVAIKALAAGAAQLRFLLVEPEARGTGLGRRLVRAAVDHARSCGARRVVLDTASDLAAARALYAAQGFRQTKATPGAPWLPPGVQSERWVLRLAPGPRG